MILEIGHTRFVTHFEIPEGELQFRNSSLPGHKVKCINPFTGIRMVQKAYGHIAAYEHAKEVLHQYINLLSETCL